MVTPQGHNLAEVVGRCAPLQKVMTKGIKAIVLREDLPDAAKQEISGWRNSDQNTSQAYHEFEMANDIIVAAKAQRLKSPTVDLAVVSAVVMGKAPVPVTQGQVSAVARFLLQYIRENVASLVTELCNAHAHLVDPQELSVPGTIFDALSKDPAYYDKWHFKIGIVMTCLLYTSPSPRDQRGSRMPSSA